MAQTDFERMLNEIGLTPEQALQLVVQIQAGIANEMVQIDPSIPVGVDEFTGPRYATSSPREQERWQDLDRQCAVIGLLGMILATGLTTDDFDGPSFFRTRLAELDARLPGRVQEPPEATSSLVS